MARICIAAIVILLFSNAVWAELSVSAQIDQKKALIITALKNRNHMDCPVVVNSTNELEQLTDNIPSKLYYYRARCLLSTGYNLEALQDLESYFLKNKKKDSVYNKALVLRSSAKARIKQAERNQVEREKQDKKDRLAREKQAALEKRQAKEAALLAKKREVERIAKLNQENERRLDKYHRDSAKLKEKLRKYYIKNCDTFKSAKRSLREYGRRCYGECKDERKLWEKDLNKQVRVIKKVRKKIDRLVDKYDDRQDRVAKAGGKRLTRYGSENPYLEDEWDKPSCSNGSISGSHLYW